MKYPSVLSERETLDRVIAGASIARYGDGELNLCANHPAKAQAVHPVLCRRLREILHDSGDCLIGIPNLHSETPKAVFWQKYRDAACFLRPRDYVSSFITRPDSAPWIHTEDYWQQLERLWLGRDVTIVRGVSVTALHAEDLTGARSVREIACPARDAFSDYDGILARIGSPDRVLLCLGPTATVLAVDLCARGVQAIDLGHVGMFIRKYRAGEPMTVTAADKAAA